ncbi:MAG: hypothetical protein FWG18_01765 [Alphaproteobacteria bacterium]|nr:hypothetical protein [Alphaproteobacteria bacterium]
MKIIFFDAIDTVHEFYKDKKFKGTDVVFIDNPAQDITAADLKAHKDADAISIFTHSELDAQTLKKFPNLKLIALRTTGFNKVDTEYCKNHGIKVSNVVGYGEVAVSEFAIGLLIALMRKILPGVKDMRRSRVDMSKYRGHDIHGKTIGVFGTGAIGAHFAHLAHAFGANVIAYDRIQNPKCQSVAKYVDLDTLYAESDIIALNIPANAQNYHIINESAIAKMKRGVILLNVARGELMDAEALYDALLSGHIGGLAQDVLELEFETVTISSAKGLTDEQLRIVLFNKKMMHMDNVIFTPHMAFNSVEATMRIFTSVYETLTAFIDGKKFRTIFD